MNAINGDHVLGFFFGSILAVFCMYLDYLWVEKVKPKRQEKKAERKRKKVYAKELKRRDRMAADKKRDNIPSRDGREGVDHTPSLSPPTGVNSFPLPLLHRSSRDDKGNTESNLYLFDPKTEPIRQAPRHRSDNRAKRRDSKE